MWDGRPHCWGKHVFKLTSITEHGIWVIHICTLQRFASDSFMHPCLWVAKRGVLVPSSQDVWLHTGNTNTSAGAIFFVVILFFSFICLSVQLSSSKLRARFTATIKQTTWTQYGAPVLSELGHFFSLVWGKYLLLHETISCVHHWCLLNLTESRS